MFDRTSGSERVSCPYHGGNGENCLINYESQTWRCFSHNCHEEIGHKLSDLAKYLGEDYHGVIKKKIHKPKAIEYLSKSLIPSYHGVPYFESRGFLKKTIEAYRAFVDNRPTSRLYKRAIIPIFDENGNLVGLTGRALYKSSIKWKHYPENFPRNRILYNMGLARNHLINDTIILVEGPLDVWRLFECGIYNVVAILGTSISQAQIKLLQKFGVKRVIVIFDPDDAGQQATLNPHKLAGELLKHFEVASLRHLLKDDVGDLSTIKLKPLIREIRRMCSI